MNQLYSTPATTPATMDTKHSYSYEGFQPPLDNSQECCPLLPKYEDPERHESKHNLGKTGNEFKATFYNPFETKHRRRTSRTQFRILEAAFEDNPKPSAAKRQSLAEELSMTPRGVQIWFQNRRAKAKQRTPEEMRKRPLEDDDDCHPRRRTKPFYTEWDSQQPIVTNDGASNGTTSLHVTPPSPPCIAGIHPVQAPPPLCYCYSDSSSPVTPSVPSPTLQDPDMNVPEYPKSIWTIDNSFIPIDSTYYVAEWMDRSLRHEPQNDFRAEHVLPPQWSKEQVTSFPSTPSSPLYPQQPVIHTADNKDNSIDLARVYDASAVDSNFAHIIDVHWIPDHLELNTW